MYTVAHIRSNVEAQIARLDELRIEVCECALVEGQIVVHQHRAFQPDRFLHVVEDLAERAHVLPTRSYIEAFICYHRGHEDDMKNCYVGRVR